MAAARFRLLLQQLLAQLVDQTGQRRALLAAQLDLRGEGLPRQLIAVGPGEGLTEQFLERRDVDALESKWGNLRSSFEHVVNEYIQPGMQWRNDPIELDVMKLSSKYLGETDPP